jgi:hypothetical protein
MDVQSVWGQIMYWAKRGISILLGIGLLVWVFMHLPWITGKALFIFDQLKICVMQIAAHFS